MTEAARPLRCFPLSRQRFVCFCGNPPWYPWSPWPPWPSWSLVVARKRRADCRYDSQVVHVDDLELFVEEDVVDHCGGVCVCVCVCVFVRAHTCLCVCLMCVSRLPTFNLMSLRSGGRFRFFDSLFQFGEVLDLTLDVSSKSVFVAAAGHHSFS